MTDAEDIKIVTDELSSLSVSKTNETKDQLMPDQLSVYVPLNSLNEPMINSIVSTVLYSTKKDWHHSKRTLLAFLLAIHNRVSTDQTNPIRQLLVDKSSPNDVKEIDWNILQEQYEQMMSETEDGTSAAFEVQYEPYYELKIGNVHADIVQSREYMTRFRSQGWQSDELKLYWNVKQIENLCNEELECDPSDSDAVLSLRQNPVSKRNHQCKITFVNKGIEKAVFDAPDDAQLIVLNFANERSPGGGYLRHSWAQEEIILYNSDGYRSLLDLKYGRMGGGYALPEFGLAYVRDMRFFDNETGRDRKTDMLVSACYCLLDRPQLYDNPTTKEELLANTLAKFRAFIAAAVANTKGDGSNTYLLLGPIGTGAFGNEADDIGHAFREVLSSEMMGSTGPIRNAFKHIWFVSIDQWKNDLFEEILK